MKQFLLVFMVMSRLAFPETSIDFEIKPQWLGIPWKDTAPLQINPSYEVRKAGKIKKLEWFRRLGMMEWVRVPENAEFKEELKFLDAKAKDSALHTITNMNLNAYLFTPATHSFRAVVEGQNGFKQTLEFDVPVVLASKIKSDGNLKVSVNRTDVPEKERELLLEATSTWVEALGLRTGDRITAYEIRFPGDNWKLHNKKTPEHFDEYINDTEPQTIFKFEVIREGKKITLVAYQGKE